MSAPKPIAHEIIPKLMDGVRLTESPSHEGWVLLAFGQSFEVGAVSVAVLERCSGSATFGGILENLKLHYGTSHAHGEAEATSILRTLEEKKLVEL